MRKVFKSNLFVLVTFLTVSYPGLANTAKETASNPQVKAAPGPELAANTRKRTTIEFDEQKIKGIRRIPIGSLITKERSNFKVQLILMRSSWKKKIINSVSWL